MRRVSSRFAGAPWFKRGLPFECTGCGGCCVSHGEHTHVYVNAGERRRLAEKLGMGLDNFEREFCTRDDEGHTVLRPVPHDAGGSSGSPRTRCVFLDTASGGCRVYGARPTQCRTWPFWPEMLKSREVYRREVQSFCPGSCDGPLVGPRRIRLAAAESERSWNSNRTERAAREKGKTILPDAEQR